MPRKVRTLSDLLDEVLALPAEQRMGWVDAQRDAAPELHDRLRALVARSCAPEQSAWLGTLPKVDRSGAAALAAEEVAHFLSYPHAPGERIDAYRLIRSLGAGAMGSVWLAEHDTARTQVAIKFAHMAPKRPDHRERLQRERQLLARLDHPNIAKLYDAGITTAGQPYLLLEYVAGERLDAYRQRQRLALQARLALFLQIALAVAHAHDQRIVHRDLKPANVMVSPDGAIRLLDFGIGKLLSDGIPLSLSVPALTPSYASPEQLLGGTVEFASDIYSLGIVLHELLTGTRPHESRSTAELTLRRAVHGEAVAPPSAHAELHTLPAPLREALDALVLTALEKHPAQRQASARDLAHEVHAVLEETARVDASALTRAREA